MSRPSQRDRFLSQGGAGEDGPSLLRARITQGWSEQILGATSRLAA